MTWNGIERCLRTPLYFVILSLLFCGLPVIALGDDVKDGEVAVGGEMLFRIRVPAEGKTIKQRADEVTIRLPAILSMTDLKPSDIQPVKAGKDTVKIMVRKSLLVTVTPEDGKANGLTAMQQAQVWVKNLRKVLPTVSAKPNPKGP